MSRRVINTVGVDSPENRKFGIYSASVLSNKDPMGLGRVLLQIPQVLGSAISNWAYPMGATTNVATGQYVYVSFLGGDINKPLWIPTFTQQNPGVISAFDWLNVKEAPFNATGDAVTDDTVAIQLAFDTAQPGQIVYFPKGIYIVSQWINVPQGIVIRGCKGTTTSSFDENSDWGTVIKPSATFSLAGMPTYPLQNPALSGTGNNPGGILVIDGITNGSNAGIQMYDFWVDGRNLPNTIPIDGITFIGRTVAFLAERVGVFGVPGRGWSSYQTNFGGTLTPDGHHFLWCHANSCYLDGFFGKFVDSTSIGTHSQNNGQSGIGDGLHHSGNNSRYIGCRFDLNQNGATFDSSSSGGGFFDPTVLINCGSQRNNQHGCLITNTSSNGAGGRLPVKMIGCTWGEDGVNGGAGGGGYAGVRIEGNNVVLISDTDTNVGTVDVAAGCPQYALSIGKTSGGTTDPSFISWSSGVLNYPAGSSAINDPDSVKPIIGLNVVTAVGGSYTSVTAYPAAITPAVITMVNSTNTYGGILSVKNTFSGATSAPFGMFGQTSGDSLIAARVTGDTASRWKIDTDGVMKWGPGGSATQDTTFGRISAGVVGATSSDIAVETAGNTLRIKEGTNAKMGTATLSSGTVVVSTTAITSSSRVFLSTQSANSTTPGVLRVSARTAGTSFTITSTSGTDGSTVAWLLLEPA